ncbi:hypothetical protein GQX73_g3418 [Xylaria multiplex]|uniref:Uncharacterized protein n=1 Tax=Xylaria multiplex TaxID=323545 RepID=A0A7C8MUV6_9PEZI|nr:hypothetical protein GQX73_g3418 [Xylaria multiplex]
MITNAFSIDKDHQFKNWPLSLDVTEEPTANRRRRRRRRAHRENNTFSNPYNLPSSLPITMSEASSRKRCADKLDSPAGKPPSPFDTFGLSLTSRVQPTPTVTSELYSSTTPSRHIPSQALAKEDAQPKAQSQTLVNVRMVPAMSAMIWGEYISATASKTVTFWEASALPTASSETGSQVQGRPVLEDPGTKQYFSGTDLYNQAYNCSEGKKVDYLLAAYPLDNTPLQKVISSYVDNEAIARDLLPHVNQTIYAMSDNGAPMECVKKPGSVLFASQNSIVYQDDNGVEHTINLPQGPMKSAEPNNMTYQDGNGVEHSIYLPQGTMHTAWEHLENQRWDELAKFAPYTNQGYSEDDFNFKKNINHGSSQSTAQAKAKKEDIL